MHQLIRNFSIGFVSAIAVIGHSSWLHAQTFDGIWDGYYVCGGHALKPEFGAFSWQRINFNIGSGQISGRHDFINRFNVPMDVVFNGRVDKNGSVVIDVVSRRQTDAKEDFHQRLEGRSVSSGEIEVTGLMMNSKGAAVRDCRLTLRASLPAQATTLAQSIPPASSQGPTTAAQRAATETERQRLEADKQAVATERKKAVEAAQQAAIERREATEQVRKAEDARRAAEEALSALASRRGTPPMEPTGSPPSPVPIQPSPTPPVAKASKAATSPSEAANGSTPNPVSTQTEKTTNLRAATSPTLQTVNLTIVQLGLLPPTERPLDWQPWAAKIPLQERQFCEVMGKFEKDLKQAENNRNEIKYNMSYKRRQEDLANLIPTGVFQDWVLRAVEVRQADDGSAAILLQAPCSTLIGTYLGPYPCGTDPTRFEGTIPEDSPQYRELEKLDHNGFVLVGGELVAVKEPTPQPLPSYKTFHAGTYCTKLEAGKEQELFLTKLHSIFALITPIDGE
jgi:hypothetical protein